MLVLWLVALVLCLYVAVDETGRNEMCALRHVHRGKPRACGCGVPGVGCALTRNVVADVQAFNQQLELAFVEENWGTTYEQVFTDIQNGCVGRSNSRALPCLTHSLLQRRHVVVA